MEASNAQSDPALREEINSIKKKLSEKDGLDRMKAEFKNIIRNSKPHQDTIKKLRNIFDQMDEGESFEDGFCALSGLNRENKDLDNILKEIARAEKDKLPEDLKNEMFRKFVSLYNTY